MDESIKEKIKKSVIEHGFLLEEEIKNFLKMQNWQYESSVHFEDQEEGKSREIDIIAYKTDQYENFEPEFTVYIRFDLVIECKNLKDFVIFLSTKRSNIDNFFWKDLVNFYSPYEKIDIRNEPNAISTQNIEKYLKINEYHHFFKENKKATNLVLAKEKSNYQIHDKEIYKEVIIPLLKASLSHYRVIKDSTDTIFKSNHKSITFSFIIPIIVFENNFYGAFFENNELKLVEKEYIQFVTDYRSNAITGRFQIDIVSKKYFEIYLNEKINTTITTMTGIILNKFADIAKYGRYHHNF